MAKPIKNTAATVAPVVKKRSSGIFSRKVHGSVTVITSNVASLGSVISRVEEEGLRFIQALVTPTHQLVLLFRERVKREAQATD